uniref:hypothetical protein n=1 Tax=Gluconobacter thailandicus TaxID=257438 RepID=UPI000AD44E35|nr:hypothetical protein [Gluconobacter thailandicus]
MSVIKERVASSGKKTLYCTHQSMQHMPFNNTSSVARTGSDTDSGGLAPLS